MAVKGNKKPKRRHRQKPAAQRAKARERIKQLFEQAENQFKTRPDLSNRYVQLARKIAMKYKVSIPSELKKRFCKHCYSYLVPGANCRVRLENKNKKLVYYCLNCRDYMRFPYIKKKAQKTYKHSNTTIK